jgi:hypothetical protein
MRRICLYFLLFTLLTTLVGCATMATPIEEEATIQRTIEIREGATPSPTEAEPSPTLIENPEEVEIVNEGPAEAASYDPALEPLVTKALEDLSGRLKVGVDEIIVVEAVLVVWPDASLGCPQPGMVYAQVPVDGTLIRLSVGGKVYEYHGGGWTDPFLCEEVIKTKPTTPKIDITISTPPPRDSGDK